MGSPPVQMSDGITFTIHAAVQMSRRRISEEDVTLRLQYGDHNDGSTPGTHEAWVELEGRPLTVVHDSRRFEASGVNGGEIMYRQGGSRAEMWRLKSVPPVAFNQERPNLTEGGLDVQGGYLPPCSQGLFRRRDERPRGGPSVRATPGHGAQDARVLRAPRVSTATTGSQTEARSI